jgi:hypothetical protein
MDKPGYNGDNETNNAVAKAPRRSLQSYRRLA